MPINFDDECFAAVHEAFGEPVEYRPFIGVPFPISDAIFEEVHRAVDLGDGGPEASMAGPSLTVRLSKFLNHLPRQNDKVCIGTRIFVVKDVHPDRDGLARLPLQLERERKAPVK